MTGQDSAPEPQDKARELFLTASKIESYEDREKWLSEQCGDDKQLYFRVLGLIQETDNDAVPDTPFEDEEFQPTGIIDSAPEESPIVSPSESSSTETRLKTEAKPTGTSRLTSLSSHRISPTLRSSEAPVRITQSDELTVDPQDAVSPDELEPEISQELAESELFLDEEWDEVEIPNTLENQLAEISRPPSQPAKSAPTEDASPKSVTPPEKLSTETSDRAKDVAEAPDPEPDSASSQAPETHSEPESPSGTTEQKTEDPPAAQSDIIVEIRPGASEPKSARDVEESLETSPSSQPEASEEKTTAGAERGKTSPDPIEEVPPTPEPKSEEIPQEPAGKEEPPVALTPSDQAPESGPAGTSAPAPKDSLSSDSVSEKVASVNISTKPKSASQGLEERVGPYLLTERIGEGRFGSLFRAIGEEEQAVAIKIIKPGLNSLEIIKRYEAQQEKLAKLSHPNIAQVYQVGKTISGRTCFIGDLVEGIPITRYCEAQTSSTTDRLKLFQTVCLAVQHAHDRGVLHRDLRPSNVLVSLAGENPTIKVTDFGLAKAIGSRLRRTTPYPSSDGLPRALQYWSPEQLKTGDASLDKRADVYALGVLLYELLTGTPPRDSRGRSSFPLTVLQSLVGPGKPERPSRRVMRTARRSRTSKHPRRALTQELDQIALKALENSLTKRYETVADLVQDIQCYLDSRPISAPPPTASDRVREIVFQNPERIAAVATVTIVLGVGLVAGAEYLSKQESLRIQNAAADLISEGERLMGVHLQSADYLDVSFLQRAAEISQRANLLLKERGQTNTDVWSMSQSLEDRIALSNQIRLLNAEIENILLTALSLPSGDWGESEPTHEKLARAFASYGFEPLKDSVLAEQLEDTRSVACERLLGGLNLWADALAATAPQSARQLTDIIAKTDSGRWLQSIRQALARNNPRDIAALADSPSLASYPTLTAITLASWKVRPEVMEPVEQILRQLQEQATSKFWPNYCLGLHLAKTVDETLQLSAEVKDLEAKLPSEVYIDAQRSIPQPAGSRSELDEAIDHLSAALSAEPEATIVRKRLALYLAASGNTTEAIREINATLTESGPNHPLDILVGLTLSDRGQDRYAVPLLKEASETGKRAPELLRIRGQAYANLGRYDEAESSLLHASRIIGFLPSNERESRSVVIYGERRPFDSLTAKLLVMEMMKVRRDRSAAITYGRQIKQAHPEEPLVDLAIANGALLDGDFADATAILDGLLENGHERAGVLAMKGALLLSAERYDEALPLLEKAVQITPDYADAQLNYGATLLGLERMEEAETPLRAALELSPNRSMAWNNLAAWHAQRGESEEAIQHLGRALELDRNNLQSTLNLLGIFVGTERFDEAVKTCLDSTLPEAYRYLGTALLEHDQPEKAVVVSRRAVEHAPKDIPSLQQLGIAHTAAGQLDEAAEAFQSIIDLEPRTSAPYLALTTVLIHQGHFEQAATTMLSAIDLTEDLTGIDDSLLILGLLGSGRLSAAQELHITCEHDRCPLERLKQAEKDLEALLLEGTAQPSEIQQRLTTIHDEVFLNGNFAHLKLPSPSGSELRALWDNREEAKVGPFEKAKIRLIVVSDSSVAEEIQGRLRKGASFANLATKHSEHPSKGESFLVSPGTYTEAIDQAIFSLRLGDYTQTPVLVNSKHFFVQVNSRTKEDESNLERGSIQEALSKSFTRQQRLEWQQNYLNQLRNRSTDVIAAKAYLIKAKYLLENNQTDDARPTLNSAFVTLESEFGPEHPLAPVLRRYLQRIKPTLKTELEASNRSEKPNQEAVAESVDAEVDERPQRAITDSQQGVEVTLGLLEKGRSLRQNDEFVRALTPFEEAMIMAKALPDGGTVLATSLLELGKTRYVMGRLQAAKDDFNRALKLVTTQSDTQPASQLLHAEILTALGKLESDFGELKAASAHLDQALTLEMESTVNRSEKIAEIKSYQGLTLARQGRLEEARNTLDRAIEINKTPHTLNNLGYILIQLGQYSQANEILEEAIQAAGVHSSGVTQTLALAWNNLGELRRLEGLTSEAKNHYEQALTYAEKLPDKQIPLRGFILNNLALVQTGKDPALSLVEALNIAKRVFPTDSDLAATCQANLAQALAAAGNLNQAESNAKEAVWMAERLSRNNDRPQLTAMTLQGLARVQLQQKQYKEAEKTARQSLGILRDLHPSGHPMLRQGIRNLISIVQRQLRFSAMRPLVRELLDSHDRFPSPPDFHPRLQGEYGRVLLELGEHEEAEKHLATAIESFENTNPSNLRETSQRMSELAKTQLALGNYDAALESNEVAIRFCRDNLGSIAEHLPLHLNLKSEIHRKKGEFGKALTSARDALTRAEADADSSPYIRGVCSRQVGLALAALERYSEAEDRLETAFESVQGVTLNAEVFGELLAVINQQGKTNLRNQLVFKHGDQLLNRLNNLLTYYRSSPGSWAETEQRIREILKLQGVLGREINQPDNLRLQVMLGTTLTAQGLHREAIVTIQEALDKLDRLEDFPEIELLHARRILAFAMQKNQQHEEAISTCQNLLNQVRTREATDQLEAFVLLDLAESYLATGRYDEAEDAYDDATKLASPEGEDKLTTDLLLARIKSELRQFPDSNKLFQTLSTTAELTLPHWDSTKAEIKYSYANSLAAQNRKSEAVALAREALDIREKVLRTDHPEIEQSAKLVRELQDHLVLKR